MEIKKMLKKKKIGRIWRFANSSYHRRYIVIHGFTLNKFIKGFPTSPWLEKSKVIFIFSLDFMKGQNWCKGNHCVPVCEELTSAMAMDMAICWLLLVGVVPPLPDGDRVPVRACMGGGGVAEGWREGVDEGGGVGGGPMEPEAKRQKKGSNSKNTSIHGFCTYLWWMNKNYILTLSNFIVNFWNEVTVTIRT